MSKLTDYIRKKPLLKRLAGKLMIPENDFRPRWWVRTLVNPFFIRKGRGAIMRRSVRKDVFPYHSFQIGSGVLIEDFTTINNGVGAVIIGDKSVIGISNVIIGPVRIGNHVMLAQNVVVSGLNHEYADISMPPSQQKVAVQEIRIGDNVWIGANSVITAGVTIGRHAVIGAGSVVTQDIPDFAVAVGSPARVVKKYNFGSGLWEKV
ncbi:MAG TPA: acyltransferase [Sphingobacteriaceae bacterium]